jgi:hypothetical protein
MLMLPTAPDVLDLLSTIPVPAVAPWADRTRLSRWRPIQHGLLARTLLEEAEDHGLEILRHGWEVAGPGDTDLFGTIDLRGGSRVQMPEGLCFSIGVRHSNAGRYALTLVTGARVMVCSNGVLSGERVLARRHTDDLDLRDVVRGGLADSIALASSVGIWVEHLQDTKVSPQQADRMMMEGARTRVLPWSALRKVDHAWRCPPHDVFRPRTAWSLYNAFTEAARERKPAAQLKALRGLRELF